MNPQDINPQPLSPQEPEMIQPTPQPEAIQPITPQELTQPMPEPFAPQPGIIQPQTVSPSLLPIDPVAPQQPFIQPMVQPTMPGAMPQPMMQPAHKSSKLPIIIILAVVGVLVVGGIVAAIALPKKDNKAKTPVVATKLDLGTSTSDDTTKTPDTTTAGGKETLNVDKTITDDVMGVTIKINKVLIAPFDIPAKYQEANPDKVIVLVDMDITNGGKYANTASNELVSVLTTRSIPYSETTSIMTDALKANGYVDITTNKDKTHAAGVMGYLVDKDELKSKITIEYKRLAATVLGSDQQIPSKVYDISVR